MKNKINKILLILSIIIIIIGIINGIFVTKSIINHTFSNIDWSIKNVGELLFILFIIMLEGAALLGVGLVISISCSVPFIATIWGIYGIILLTIKIIKNVKKRI